MVDKATRVLLSLNGPLQILPFSALVTAIKPKVRYFSDEKPLDVISSLTVFLESRNRILPPGRSSLEPLVAFGDPIYNKDQIIAETGEKASEGRQSPITELENRGLRLVPLPGTRDEVKGIAKLFGTSAITKLGPSATKTAAKEYAPEAGTLHFACHGWFDDQVGLNSGLALTRPEALGKEATDDNGLLQAWEIFEQLRLKASLVVLSACQTGLGQELRGEGIIGLTRAFLYAGAESVVVSLWEVNDRSTAELMRIFYQELLQAATKDEALQRAMVNLKKDPRWRHPFYWSPFILVGDWK